MVTLEELDNNKKGYNMSNNSCCDGNCSCTSTTKVHTTKYRCPECGALGTPVSSVTVKNLTKDKNLIKGSELNICKTSRCITVYFNMRCSIVKDDVKVPVWYKDGAQP